MFFRRKITIFLKFSKISKYDERKILKKKRFHPNKRHLYQNLEAENMSVVAGRFCSYLFAPRRLLKNVRENSSKMCSLQVHTCRQEIKTSANEKQKKCGGKSTEKQGFTQKTDQFLRDRRKDSHF